MEKYVRFYCNERDILAALPPETAVKLVLAALDYKDNGQEPDTDDAVFQMAWLPVRNRLRDEHETYLRKCEAGRKAAAKRWSGRSNSAGRTEAAEECEEWVTHQDQDQDQNHDQYKETAASGGERVSHDSVGGCTPHAPRRRHGSPSADYTTGKERTKGQAREPRRECDSGGKAGSIAGMLEDAAAAVEDGEIVRCPKCDGLLITNEGSRYRCLMCHNEWEQEPP